MLFPYKAETELRFAEINRGITDNEFCGALELARAAASGVSTPAGAA